MGDFGFYRAVVVMDDVVRTQKDVESTFFSAFAATEGIAFDGSAGLEGSEFYLDQMFADDFALQEYSFAYEVSDEAIAGLVVEVVGGVPLLNATVGDDAYFVGHGEGFALVVSDQDGSGAAGFENVTYFQ